MDFPQASLFTVRTVKTTTVDREFLFSFHCQFFSRFVRYETNRNVSKCIIVPARQVHELSTAKQSKTYSCGQHNARIRNL
jgi:hypothetical protein